jgi:hypothetical protein
MISNIKVKTIGFEFLVGVSVLLLSGIVVLLIINSRLSEKVEDLSAQLQRQNITLRSNVDKIVFENQIEATTIPELWVETSEHTRVDVRKITKGKYTIIISFTDQSCSTCVVNELEKWKESFSHLDPSLAQVFVLTSYDERSLKLLLRSVDFWPVILFDSNQAFVKTLSIEPHATTVFLVDQAARVVYYHQSSLENTRQDSVFSEKLIRYISQHN